MAIDLTYVLSLIPALGALGTASMGIVDSSKVFNKGPSNFGFHYIKDAVGPFLAVSSGNIAFGQRQALATLKANYINGVDTSTQKATAKALIHLSLTPESAANMAALAGVDPEVLKSLVMNVANEKPPPQSEINVLGRFDVVLSAVLDEAYERADQRYRNSCKMFAALVSVVLAVIAGSLYEDTFRQVMISGFLGFVAVPLAPVAKDAASALQAFATALNPVSPRI